MKMAAVSIVLLLFVLAADVASAQIPSVDTDRGRADVDTNPRPTPTSATRPAVGDFTVVPASGPVGTLVTVSGNFDEDITGVRFHCFYHTDTIDEGLIDIPNALPHPSPSFSLEFEIPATLLIRQGGGETRPTPTEQCEFLAMAGHQLLTASVPFTVTASPEAILPSTGTGPASRDAGWPLEVALALGLLSAAAVWVGRSVRP